MNDSEQDANETEDSDESEKSEDDKEDKSEDEVEDKPKKKFKFKAKKKNETVEVDFDNNINESVEPTVLDFVRLKSNGLKGQVISHFADDRNSMVVHVDGHTIVCTPNEVDFINPKQDTLPPHMKFDPLTLKGIYESYVGCGLFVNGVKITPNDCQVKVSDYFSSSDNKEIEIVIEGEKTLALKKYISLTENINDVIDIANYVNGKMSVSNEEIDVLIHSGDYTRYKNIKESYTPVRTLVFVDGVETKLNVVPGSSLKLDTVDDLYIPESEISINSAVNKLL